MIIEPNKLYRIEYKQHTDNFDNKKSDDAPITFWFGGDTISCNIYSSSQEKDTVAEMNNIDLPEITTPITLKGSIMYYSLFEYFVVSGTVETLEVTGINALYVKDII